MTSNFDKTFEQNKTKFKQKFNVEWNTEPQLYINYIQTIYLSFLSEIANNSLGQISNQQNETHKLLQHISQTMTR